jgi:hypothetical protein
LVDNAITYEQRLRKTCVFACGEKEGRPKGMPTGITPGPAGFEDSLKRKFTAYVRLHFPLIRSKDLF